MRTISIIFAVALASCSLAGNQAKPLAGTDGVIGKPTRVGQFQFTLVGAKFDTRVITQEDTWIAAKGKKYLVLTFSVQNPGKSELTLEKENLSFTVVGADTNNYTSEPTLVNPEKMLPIRMDLKPVQKAPGMVFIEVPGDDPIHKLIVRSRESAVVRYDLRGKTAKADGLFAEKNGVTIADTGNAKIGQKIELGYFNVTVDSVDESTAAIGSKAPDDGKKLVVVHVTFGNPSFKERMLERSTYKWDVLDANGEKLEFSDDIIRESSADTLAATVDPSRSMKARLIFYAPKDSKPATVVLSLTDYRTVSIAVTPTAKG